MAKKNKKQGIGLDEKLSKSEAFIEKHLKQIGVVLGVICVVVIGIYLWNNHKSKLEQEAAGEISKSQQAFAQAQFKQALEGDGSTKGLLAVIKEYSGTKTANLAKAYAGLCYYNLDQYDDAINMLKDYDVQKDAVISPAILEALGNCYVEKGDVEKGIEQILKAAKLANNDTASPIFLLHAGELYESLGKTDKALEIYKEIKEKYYRSSLFADIDKYIERASK
ncbi:MAG: tetratricopeptide repeat protein [Prevotellaceae bacterium]|nr:tetratricopeptide repeat protein [Candidatus Colivivens equi]